MKSALRIALFTPLFAVSTFALAEKHAENLVQVIPTGYKIDYRQQKDKMQMVEMVPESQTVANWNEMLTTQVFHDTNHISLAQFQKLLAKNWSQVCKDGKSMHIVRGKENGYHFVVWQQSCPLNPVTGQMEKTWFKAIKGKDSLYVVQKAFKFEPSTAEREQWMQYLRSVVVCNAQTNKACSQAM